MKNKIIIYAVFAFLLISTAQADRYFVLSVNYILGSLSFNSIDLKDFGRTITHNDNAGFTVKIVSFEDSEIRKVYYNISENKNYLIYLPYDKNAARIEVYNLQNSKIMDIDVSSFADTCGNAACESYESYESCKADCKSGSRDDFCDGVKDGICDPDCSAKLDSDCQETKQNESFAKQTADNDKNTNQIRKEEQYNWENNKFGYWMWLLYGAGFFLIVFLALLFIKKRKNDRAIGMLRQYIAENIKKGFTLDQIKQVLFREGYSEKEIDRAIKTIGG